MKKILFSLAAIICLLATTNHVSAQFIVHPNGNAEVGENCFDPENPGLAPIYLQWLDMWTGIPLQYSGVTVARSNSAVSLTGLSAGDTVSYCSNDGSVGRVLATSSGVSLTGVDPNSTIMVYQHNRIPYIAPLVIQNTDLDRSQYVIASEVLAGRQVDSSRTNGDVTVKNGAEYEIEAASEVTLAGGFTVEKGAAFAIRPACF